MRLLEVFSDNDADTNFTLPFSKLCKKYGKEYLDYLFNAYAAFEGSEIEFCRINHCPISFMPKVKEGAQGIEVKIFEK